LSHEPYYNNLGQPIGFPVAGWETRPWPPRTAMAGRFCRMEPLDPERHVEDLYGAFSEDTEQRNWTYLLSGPYPSLEAYREWMNTKCLGDDPLYYAILDPETGNAIGVASYLRIAPEVGVIEVGHIHFSPRLQKTPAATEAMYLMMRRVFEELGYRRYEWKCDSLNAGSRRAAERLGFQFEGIFRQAIVYKGRNRDTAWYSILDTEWPALKSAFERWLAPANFDHQGRQRERLSDLIRHEQENRQTS
jgi:RimJ/RimL family protein N-acetyltransferase